MIIIILKLITYIKHIIIFRILCILHGCIINNMHNIYTVQINIIEGAKSFNNSYMYLYNIYIYICVCVCMYYTYYYNN